jgi:two-component system phosphate regulon sensor histidine kinase PhoR
MMAGETERMTRLVNDLLSLSRIEQTEHQLPQDRVDPAECVESVVETLRSYALRRRVVLQLRHAPELPLVVGDRDQLFQLISNLIDNAIKYGGEDRTVDIVCERVDQAPVAAGALAGRAAVRMIVADQGQGIAREQFLKMMAGETERMTRLVDDLLSLSRIEQTEHRPPQERVDPGECIESVVETLRSYALRRRVVLHLKRDSKLPLVTGDRDQMFQLISNLIDNAIKYGGEGSAVEITCERVGQAPVTAGALAGRPAVRMIVADQGQGIAREHLPRLTERFFRVEPARSRQLGGTGLGLAIVKHILRRHRGHLALESEPGRGTIATVYLPVSGAEGEA